MLEQEYELALKDTNKDDLMEKWAANAKMYRKSILKDAINIYGIINGAQQANAILRKKLNMDHAQIEEGMIAMFGDYIIKVKAFESMLRQNKLPESVIESMLERFVAKMMPVKNSDSLPKKLSDIKMDQLVKEMKAGNVANQQILRKGIRHD